MKKIIILLAAGLTTGCEFVVVEGHHGYEYESPHHHQEICYVEPLAYAPEQCWDIWDGYGYYEGECCEWDIGNGHFEDWCLWNNQCDWEWEYTGHYTDVHHHDTPHYH